MQPAAWNVVHAAPWTLNQVDGEAVAPSQVDGASKVVGSASTRLDYLVLPDVVEHVAQGFLDVQLPRPAGGIDAVPIVEAIGDIRRRLDLRDHNAGAECMHHTTGQVEAIAGSGIPGTQQVRDRRRVGGAGDIVWPDAGLQADVKLRARFRMDDVPGFVLDPRPPAGGVVRRGLGMNLHAEVLARVEELD